MVRQPTQVRQVLHALGMQPRTVGMIPAQAGHRALFFMDAAPVVLGPCWGIVWGVQRRGVNTPSGRQRLHGLAAFNALTHALGPVEPLSSRIAEPVWALWRRLAAAHHGIPLRVMLDKARDQRCAVVQAGAPG
jgi:hypothetical protein